MNEEDLVCIADGITSSRDFRIRNAKDLEEAKFILNEPYIRKKDVDKYYLYKPKVKEVIDKLRKQWHVASIDIVHPTPCDGFDELEKELGGLE